MNKKIIVFVYCLFSIPFMSIHSWDTFDKQYACRSNSNHSEDGEGKLECWVCDKNNTPEPETFRQAVIYCLYTSHTQKEKDSSGKLINANAWIKLPMPDEIIQNNVDDGSSSSQNFGTYPIGVDKVQFIKTNNTTSGSDAWVITLHRKYKLGCDGFNTYFYTYIIITRTFLSKSLNYSLLDCKYKDTSPFIYITNSSENTYSNDNDKLSLNLKNTAIMQNDIKNSVQNYNITQTLQQQLFTAVTSNNIATIQTILNNEPSLNPNELLDGGNALTTAAYYGYDNIVTLLLQFTKINVNFKDVSGHTALYYAQQNLSDSSNKTNIINALTKQGAKAQ